jgi:hypothetical protein
MAQTKSRSDWTISEIKSFPCKSKLELETEERNVIQQFHHKNLLLNAQPDVLTRAPESVEKAKKSSLSVELGGTKTKEQYQSTIEERKQSLRKTLGTVQYDKHGYYVALSKDETKVSIRKQTAQFKTFTTFNGRFKDEAIQLAKEMVDELSKLAPNTHGSKVELSNERRVWYSYELDRRWRVKQGLKLLPFNPNMRLN